MFVAFSGWTTHGSSGHTELIVMYAVSQIATSAISNEVEAMLALLLLFVLKGLRTWLAHFILECCDLHPHVLFCASMPSCKYDLAMLD